MEESTREGAGRGRGTAVLAVLALVVLAAVTVAWRWPRLPADDSPEAGFARDMATHHDQAAEMAFIVRDVTTDARLRALTYDIIVTQTAQRGVFMGWLQQWGLPQASAGPRMTWMHAQTHGAHPPATSGAGAGLMPGMASAREMEELRAARPAEAEVLFLKLMIRHHEGGVQMARALLAQSSNEHVVGMAGSIEASQAAEIALMKELLAERGGEPLPSILK
jgi:uncharacterized protein (DUF305 family)